jgi:valyl-tRNA synthetase
MVSAYPSPGAGAIDEAAERDFALVREVISGVRNLRTEYRVEPARLIAATVVAGGRAAQVAAQRSLIARLARVADDQLAVVETLDIKPQGAAALVVQDVEVYLPLAGLIDLQAERARLRKDLEAAEADIARRVGRLANEGFTARAPAQVVQRERDGLAAVQATAERLRERLAELGAWVGYCPRRARRARRARQRMPGRS